VIVRGFKYLLMAVVLLLAVALIGGWWLLQTSSGSRWLWGRTADMIPGELQAQSISGSIGGELALAGVSYLNETIEVSVAEARLSARLVLFPLSVEVRDLQADGVVVRRQRKEPEPPGDPILGKLALPIVINAEAVTVSRLQLLNSDDEAVFALDKARLAGRWHDEISLSRFEIDSSLGQMDGTVVLGLAEPHPARASVAGRYPLRQDDRLQPVQFTLNAEGSLASLNVDLSVIQPDLNITGELSDLTEQPRWNVRVQTTSIQWPVVEDPNRPATVYLRDTALETAGSLSAYSIAGQGRVSVAGKEELPFTISTDGDADGLDVRHLDLRGEMLRATAEGNVHWAGGLAIAADADIGRFDVGVLTPQWPDDAPVSGTVAAAWSAGKVELKEVRLRVQESEARVDATGVVDIDGGVVDLDLDWGDLQWPMQEETGGAAGNVIGLRSEFGQINFSGRPEAWKFDGRVAFQASDLPQGVFVLSGVGDRDQVEATLHESAVLGGSASGRGAFNWTEDGQWSAELVTENLDIGPLAPRVGGRVSSTFSAEGRLNPVHFAVDIERLHGTVRDRPLEGEGGLRYANGNLSAEKLRIRSGESHLRADGSLKSKAGLDFALDIASLETFQTSVAGSLRAEGNLTLGDEFPALTIDLQAHDILWREYGLGELTLTSNQQRVDAPIAIEASGSALTFGRRQIDSFSVTLAADETRQQLEIRLSPEDAQLDVELDGRLENWKLPLDSVWAGQLRSARLETAQGLTYRLDEPADLRLAVDLAGLGHACLEGEAHGRVCLDANWTGGANVDAAAQFNSVPVNLLGLFYETELEFSQTLDGSLSVNADADTALSGKGQIDISPGRIQNRIDPRLTTETGPGELRFNLVDGQLLAGRLSLPFSNSAEIDAEFELADVGRGTDSPVDGRFVAHLNNIAVASDIVPVVAALRGRLDADVAIAGTLGNPLFEGEVSLRNGALRYDPVGLALSDIELKAVMADNNQIDLQSTFRAGEGTGEVRSSAQSLNVLRDGLELSLTGDQLTLIDLPDINVVANTNLGIRIQNDRLTLNGNVLVPRARIVPTNLTSDKVSESEDVRIVANRDAEVEPENGNGAQLQIFGTVALALGEDVQVDLDVAEAALTGTAALTWNGPPVPNGNGQYNVQGKFEAYGQLLDITEGTIQFPGTSAANPNLRIRAEREIFGNPQINSAGVLITGTAQDPVVEVYTNPPSNRDRAVTLLVTGSDFNYEQGVGAVDVGTYIAPDLYISYGIGLFDRENVISLRYDIAKGFGIKATSGKSSEGVDLSYTLER